MPTLDRYVPMLENNPVRAEEENGLFMEEFAVEELEEDDDSFDDETAPDYSQYASENDYYFDVPCEEFSKRVSEKTISTCKEAKTAARMTTMGSVDQNSRSSGSPG